MRNNEKKKISRISIALVLIAILILMEVIILHNNAVKVTAIEELNSKMQESGSNMHEVEFSTIATDYNHSIAIDKNGNLWGWGYHSIYSYEQIETTDYPVKLEIQGEFKEVSMSSTHRLAIDNNGNIWSWGDNTYGELGDGSTNSKNINEAIMLESDVKFKEVLAGSNYSLAIDEAGNLWAWGYNRSGQLGDGTNTNSYEPKQIKQDTQFNKIASAYNVSLAIDKAGNLWTWGDGTKEPNKIETSTKFKEISANEDHKLAIDTLGNIWAWGTNEYAQLGDGTTTSSVNPKKITSNTKFNKISAGFLYSLAIDETGNLWAWGNNSIGQLGDGTTTKVTKPKQVTTDKKFVNVQAGHGSIDTEICNLALDENGKIWSWGKNTYGQLGNAQASIYSTEMLLLNTISHYTKIDTGAYSHNLAIDKEGNLWAWGDNTYGQLGDRTTTNSDIPKQIMVGTKFKEIYISDNDYSLMIDTSGNLWGTGSLNSGSVKDETTKSTSTPIQILSGTKFNKVNGLMALDVDGKIWTSMVMNGGGNSQATSVSKRIENDVTLVDINIANGRSAIDNNGGLWLWGYLPTILYRQENYTEPQKITVMDYSYEVKFMDGTKTLKTQYVSEGKSATAPEVTPKEGYKFIGWDKPFDNITSDLIVNAIWERNTFTVTFKDGTERTDTQTVNSGESATPPNWTKPGYDLSWSEDITNITSDLTVNAIWTARADTPYKVIHHFRSLDTEVEGYIEEEEPKTGTTDTVVTAEYKTREGFEKNENHPNKVETGTVAGNGSLVLHLYYNRNTYNITYELNGGTPNGTLTSKYTYGKEMILQTNRVTKEGYEFAGWYDNEELTGNPVTSIPATSTGDKTFYAKWIKNIFTVTFKDREERTDVQTINRGQNATAPNWTRAGYTLTWDTEFTNVTSDLTVNAIWTARSDTPYKVIHHFRNLDTEVEGYIDEEEAKTGTTDTVVTAEYKTREGFTKNENHPNKVETGTVTGDGSLILHLYYNRNTYNITYELNGGTQSSPLTNKYVYGKEMILQTNRVTKEGYTFAGWYDNEELEGSPVASISATSTGNKTFYAKWVEAEKEYYILSEIYNIDLTENTITKVSPETMSAEFLSKIDTNGQMKVVNARGEEITDTSLVGTGYKLQVTFKGEVHTYEIAVRGDLDGNGKITTTDLSIINQQILHKIELTGIRAKAADTDYNGRLTTTDLSMINQAVLRKIKL